MNSLSSQAGKAREIVIFGLLGGLLIAVQVGIAFLPNIELVSLLVIVYTLAFGLKALYPVYVFVLAQGLIYGFGLWFVNYLYIWAMLVFIILPLRKSESPLLFAVISGAYGLCFGALCAIPYLFIGGPGSAIAYWVNGIPFDIVHCAGNFAAALLLLQPLLKLAKKYLL